MTIAARFGHTNLIAKNWRQLARFYELVFGCEVVPPERDLSGPAIDKGTGVKNGRLRGVHLRLPGHGPDGPTLEIYTYNELERELPPAANRPGFGHIAFVVDDVLAARAEVLAAGGSDHGEVVETKAGDRVVNWVYLRDPENNLIEIQKWD